MKINGYEIKPEADLEGANLSGANLRGANLRETDLSGANLSWADLSWANLSGANLREADLRETDLSGADLREADLRETDLSGANLSWADLRETDLSGADLKGANLRGADLSGADLRGARYSIFSVLQSSLGELSDDLTTELMKWDAHATPNPGKFMEWKKGGGCPAQEHLRIFQFEESRKLFRQGKPSMTLWELWAAVAKELEISI